MAAICGNIQQYPPPEEGRYAFPAKCRIRTPMLRGQRIRRPSEANVELRDPLLPDVARNPSR